MAYVAGVERTQATLFPQSLGEYIAAENPVRFIDAFVAGLDLQALGFGHAVPAETGRPPYDPGDLLRLYIYGYLNRVRSSRRLETECQRNVEAMWLVRKLAPDFKTIADFRKDNGEAIRKVCREFTLLCKRLDLFGGELVAVDGSKFKASNARDRNYTDRKLERAIGEIDKRVDTYLKELEVNDAQEPQSRKLSAEELRQRIAGLKARGGKYQALRQELREKGETQVSLTDPDCRSMSRGKGGGTEIGYNVQAAVDEKHKLIVEHEVTNEVSDSGHLSMMATRAKAMLATEHLDVVADKGYYDGGEVKACVEQGITPYIEKPLTSANAKLGLFTKEDFRYDAQADCYWCPAGKALTYRFQTTELGREIKYYTTAECARCVIKPQCTRNKESRRITRWVAEEVLEEMQRRVASSRPVLAKRKAIVEHPFGTMKRWMDQGYFLLRRLPKVKTEMSLTVLAYNMKRAMNLLGTPAMVAAVT